MDTYSYGDPGRGMEKKRPGGVILWQNQVWECISQEAIVKQPYEKPEIVHTEVIKARAVACARGTNVDCPGGPITS
jgi:hypothetical protein